MIELRRHVDSFTSRDPALAIPIPITLAHGLLRQRDPIREVHPLPTVFEKIAYVLVIRLVRGGEDVPIVLAPKL